MLCIASGGEFQDHLENGIRSRSYIYAINGASGEVLPGYDLSDSYCIDINKLYIICLDILSPYPKVVE